MATTQDIPYWATDVGKAAAGAGPTAEQDAQERIRRQREAALQQSFYGAQQGAQLAGQRQYETQQGDVGYAREQASPQYQMGEYQVGQAQRSPYQKGTDAGTALRALQESSGLNLLGSYSATGTGGFGGGDGGAGSAPRVSMPDTAAANAAIFARAKDRAGEIARSALQGLQGEMAGRGLLGSGIAADQTRQIVERGAGGLQEVGREQAIQDALNLARRGEMQYQGDITQRGQDLSAYEAQAARDAALRAQQMQGLLSVINSAGILY